MSKRAVVMSLLVGLGAALIWSTCGLASAAPQPTQVLSAATATPAQKTKLIFWSGYTGPDGEIMADLIKKYNETHPGVEVEVFTQQWTPLYEKFVVSFRSGNQPDIMSLMGTQDIPQFIELLEPVEPYMEKIGLRPDDFAKSAWEATRYEGRSYALPLGMPMHGVYYNKDLYQTAYRLDQRRRVCQDRQGVDH